MFLSLNKKIIIAIVAFFVLCFSYLGYTLYSVYASRLQDEQIYLHSKNTQYNELLYHYNKVKSASEVETLDTLISPSTITTNTFKNQEDARYQNLQSNLYLVLSCLVFFAIMIILMITFMHNLVFLPLAYFSQINETIQKGIYKQRLHLPQKRIHDEFNNLEKTYNNMLDHIEEQINEIKSQKDFLQSIIDGIPDAIRVLDSEGNIIMANTIYKNILHQKTNSKLKNKCYASLLRKNEPCPKTGSACPLRDLSNKKSIKFIQQLPFGEKQYLSVNASRIGSAKEPLIIESFRDLSNDIQFSHQQKISSLGFLTTSITHEIKNNLGSMKLIAENILNNNVKSADKQKYIKLIYNQLLECINIPERLLKIAKEDTDTEQEINCQNEIKEIFALLDYEATHNGIKMNIEAETNLPQLKGNRTDFKMIILNLAQNAIKAMPAGGSLTAKLYTKNTNFYISIADTGKGIPSQNIPHIFEPFFSQNTSEKGHAGLGLAIVKSLVHTFEGEINVKSKLNKGTEFILKFPYNKKK